MIHAHYFGFRLPQRLHQPIDFFAILDPLFGGKVVTNAVL